MASIKPVADDFHVASITQHGDKLILPEGMEIPAAISLLQRRMTYLQEDVNMVESFDVFPWDGANALDIVLTRMYGWAPATATPSMFGKQPPSLINVEIGYKKYKKVAWGRFTLPNIDGFVQCGVDQKNGRYVFQLTAKVKRTHEQTVNKLFNELRAELNVTSIYRGQAIKIRFRNEEGKVLEMPEPSFLDTDIDDKMLIYSEDVKAAVETNLFTPIRRVEDCLKAGIPVKRGVLLGGTFGTGKTLAAKVASKYAVEHGLTYIYVPRADELSDAINFAKQYQSPAAVIFCEDIDRAVSGERTVEMDDILNVIDGIDTKTTRVIVVLTTNDLHSINPAMIRPGRLDAVIDITPPDAKAVELLIRAYGGDAIQAKEDLTEVGKTLDGAIPAVIAEVVKRAKLAQLRLQEPGTPIKTISAQALLESAKTMKVQLELLYPKAKTGGPTIETLLTDAVKNALNGQHEALAHVKQKVDDLHNNM